MLRKNIHCHKDGIYLWSIAMHIEVVIRSAVNLRHVQCVTNSVVYCIAESEPNNVAKPLSWQALKSLSPHCLIYGFHALMNCTLSLSKAPFL